MNYIHEDDRECFESSAGDRRYHIGNQLRICQREHPNIGWVRPETKTVDHETIEDLKENLSVVDKILHFTINQLPS